MSTHGKVCDVDANASRSVQSAAASEMPIDVPSVRNVLPCLEFGWRRLGVQTL